MVWAAGMSREMRRATHLFLQQIPECLQLAEQGLE
jgi:hypothetical protein